jgi:hypothetical protein
MTVVYATFWELFVLLIIWVPLITLWIAALVDILGRADLSGGAKALWIVCVLILPFVGVLVYLASRPRVRAV